MGCPKLRKRWFKWLRYILDCPRQSKQIHVVTIPGHSNFQRIWELSIKWKQNKWIKFLFLTWFWNLICVYYSKFLRPNRQYPWNNRYKLYLKFKRLDLVLMQKYIVYRYPAYVIFNMLRHFMSQNQNIIRWLQIIFKFKHRLKRHHSLIRYFSTIWKGFRIEKNWWYVDFRKPIYASILYHFWLWK